MWQKCKNLYHLGVAILANIYFRFPSRKLTVVGVTGTDGKTTTVSLIYHILHESGYNASMISTIGAIIGGKEYDIGFHVTNPASWPLQRFLKKAAEQGQNSEKKYMILEVSSHGLDQYRVWGIKFAIGIVTNITRDHLDYHKTWEKYVKAKATLIRMSKIGILNKDDKSYDRIMKYEAGINGKTILTYGMGEADITPKKFPFTSNLIGEFNDYNILAAVVACQQLGVPDDKIRSAITIYTAPKGREEIIYPSASSGEVPNLGFTVMIDFAATINSTEQILKALRPRVKGRLIHVFGSAGERDIAKRPAQGKASATYADIIVLTAEDPRSEDVNEIIDQIASGAEQENKKNKRPIEVLKIPDRKQAVDAAIMMAQRDDFVLLAGKSHEKSMNFGAGEIPWDEFAVAKEALKKREKLS